MLITPTYIDRSTIHGIGLFAEEDIEAGAIIWRATPHTYVELTQEKYEQMKKDLSVVSFSQLNKYSAKFGQSHYLCLDDARFLNHSKEGCNTNYFPEENILIATRKIKKGEEILEDYSKFYPDDKVDFT